jgi:hypothetical protein
MKMFSLSVHHKPEMKVVLTKMFSAVVQSGDLFKLGMVLFICDDSWAGNIV